MLSAQARTPRPQSPPAYQNLRVILLRRRCLPAVPKATVRKIRMWCSQYPTARCVQRCDGSAHQCCHARPHRGKGSPRRTVRSISTSLERRENRKVRDNQATSECDRELPRVRFVRHLSPKGGRALAFSNMSSLLLVSSLLSGNLSWSPPRLTISSPSISSNWLEW